MRDKVIVIVQFICVFVKPISNVAALPQRKRARRWRRWWPCLFNVTLYWISVSRKSEKTVPFDLTFRLHQLVKLTQSAK